MVWIACGGALESDGAYWVQLVVAVSLFAYGVCGNIPQTKRPKPESRPSSQKLGALFMLGAGISVVEFATVLPYLAAISILSQLDTALIVKIFILVVYNIIMIMPPLLMLMMGRFGVHKWQTKFEAWRQTAVKGSQETLYWVLGVAGFFLTASAIKHFGWFGL